MLEQILFYLPLSLIFFAEGLGLQNGREMSFYLVILWPFFLYGYDFLKKKEFLFPRTLTISYVLFLLFSFISLFFSVNKINTFFLLIYYAAIFLILVYVYNKKENLKNRFDTYTIILGLIFVFVSILVNYFNKFFPFLIPQRGYQYIYSFYGTHNPMGSLLLLPVAFFVLMPETEQRFIDKVILFFFVIFTIFSYSRAALLTLIVILLVQPIFYKQKIKPKRIFFVLLLTFFFLIIQFSNNVGFFKTANQTITKTVAKNIFVDYKGVYGGRERFYSIAIKGIIDKPLFGYGLGNFKSIVQKHQNIITMKLSETAHNIFLDMFSEGGILVGLFFVLFLFLSLKNSKKNKYFIVFLTCLFLFQIDYLHRYYSYLLYFFILIGLTYQENKNFIVNKITALSLFFLFFFASVLVRVNWNREKLEEMLIISKKTNNKELFIKTVKPYEFIFIGDYKAKRLVGGLYNYFGDKIKAIDNYKKGLDLYPANNLDLIEELYQLEVITEGKKVANKNFEDRLLKYYLDKGFDKFGTAKSQVVKLCFFEHKRKCQEIGINFPVMFFQPEPNSEILTNKIKYTLNNDGLNEKYDYSLDKPKDVFRIIALGDSQTFGLLVETKDNWTEVLEENLNKNNKCRNTKKFEVINLGVNGYDIQYAAHLFKLKGEKYQPDLVLWLIRKDNLYQLNELIIGEIIKYYKQAKNADELNGITKRINDFSIWGQISKELLTEFGGPQIFAKQRDFINYFIQSKKSNMVILFFGDFSAEEKKFIKKINIPRKDGIQIINGLDKKNYFTNFESLNNKGNKELADIIYEYFVDSRVIHCQK